MSESYPTLGKSGSLGMSLDVSVSLKIFPGDTDKQWRLRPPTAGLPISPALFFLTLFLTLIALKPHCFLLATSKLIPIQGLCTCCACSPEWSSFCLQGVGCCLLPWAWLTLVLMPVHHPGQIKAPSFRFSETFCFYHPLSLIILVLLCLDLQPENTCVPLYSLQHLKALPLGWKIPACVCAQSLQSCLTLCDRMDCNLSGSSVHRVLQARYKWVAMPSSR